LAAIKRHVRAGSNDAIVSFGSGMTAVVNKFQRILGLRVHENYRDRVLPRPEERPVVFVTHMEHHSNQTSWLETLAEVRVIPPTEDGLVDLAGLDALLEEYRARPIKIASVTSCSNVTGIFTPYHQIAQRMHEVGGWCFVDFAASAPYIDIDMHPRALPGGDLDAIFFSPHKFLGGPGTAGILIFDKRLYRNRVPDHPGGGTVDWTNPWGEHKYVDDIEAREDGGTPGFLQAIRTALAIQLKDEMGVAQILAREHQLIERLWPKLAAIPGLHVLAEQHRARIGCVSFYIDGLHYNLAVQLLNDRYGIQVRGGCSCAGTYGHYLLHVDREHSKSITDKINQGCLADKPGWVRLSLHPTMTDAELDRIAEAIEQVARHHHEWGRDYRYCERSNAFHWRSGAYGDPLGAHAERWFRALG
jgi:selenocysteine lyase/cysteine desulfurase